MMIDLDKKAILFLLEIISLIITIINIDEYEYITKIIKERLEEQEEDSDLEQLESQSLSRINEYNSESEYNSDQEYSTFFGNSINDYFLNYSINMEKFFSAFNDLDYINTFNKYRYPLNGSCWICRRKYTHECCIACHKLRSYCRCKFICRLTYPTGQKDHKGVYNQFKKCKYYTDNLNCITHRCKGEIVEHTVVLFKSEDSDSYTTFKINYEDYQ